jgi:uncharacterized radical SAM superfamily Fe-S cluster-containing enzyme
MFVAGMHFMDPTNYSARRVRRCIIKYVTTKARSSLRRYNAASDTVRSRPTGWRATAHH